MLAIVKVNCLTVKVKLKRQLIYFYCMLVVM